MESSRTIFARNLRKYMEEKGKSRKDICRDLGFRYSTFADWVNGAKYPRIDKIEKMAIYFNCKKSSLIERYDVANISTLTVDELGMIAKFRKLNKDGKERLITQLNDMLQLDKYTQEKSTIISAQ